jgi:hypothetical protein
MHCLAQIFSFVRITIVRFFPRGGDILVAKSFFEYSLDRMKIIQHLDFNINQWFTMTREKTVHVRNKSHRLQIHHSLGFGL